MSVLILQDINLYIQDRCIFDNVSLQLNSGDKACLVGTNGSGKTTLFNIISGNTQPDSGKVIFSKGSSFSYLRQELPCIDSDCSVEQYLLNIDYKEEKQDFEKQKIITPLLHGFGFSNEDRSRKIREFSPGWQMRISLIRTLASNCDFLLLDEPTNYLDIECRVFLAEYLKNIKSGFLIVSHDRSFLDSVCNITYELLAGDITKFSGNYTFFEHQKQEMAQQQAKEQERIDKEKKEILEFVEKFRYKATKARQVQERIKRLEKIQDVEFFAKSRNIHFSFHKILSSPQVLIECDNIFFGYNSEKKIIRNFSFVLEKGDRVAIIGTNGMGKTTLLKLFSKNLIPDSGTLKISEKTKECYYSQDAFSRFDRDRTILEEIRQNSTYDDMQIKSLLGSFLFTDDDVHKKIGVLSGGEKARVAICKMLLLPSNLLLLDEITNHLDISSKNVLKKALLDYPGNIVFVSHDLDFIQDIANKIIYLDAAGQHVFLGDFSYFQYKIKNDSLLSKIVFTNVSKPLHALSGRLEHDASQSGKSDCVEKPNNGKSEYEEAKKSRNERKAYERRLNALEIKESELSRQLKVAEERMSLPEIYSDILKSGNCQREIDELKKQLEDIEKEYLDLLESQI